jgi:diguanylate cyclase (GGDEF)-like protein
MIAKEDLPLYRSLLSGQTLHDVVIGVKRFDGSTVWLNVNSAPIYHPLDPSPVGAVMSFSDITVKLVSEQTIKETMRQIQLYSSELEHQKSELALANARLESLATTDGLTGLKNHRAFQDFLEHHFQLARRHNTELSLLLIDVDHFKTFNDTFGHPAGDQVLKEVALVLEEMARATDLVGRYGGEEFVLVLPKTDADGALKIAERIREATEKRNWSLRKITVSIGAATYNPQMHIRTELIEQADQALYASKQGGRNRATHFTDIKKAA